MSVEEMDRACLLVLGRPMPHATGARLVKAALRTPSMPEDAAIGDLIASAVRSTLERASPAPTWESKLAKSNTRELVSNLPTGRELLAYARDLAQRLRTNPDATGYPLFPPGERMGRLEAGLYARAARLGLEEQWRRWTLAHHGPVPADAVLGVLLPVLDSFIAEPPAQFVVKHGQHGRLLVSKTKNATHLAAVLRARFAQALYARSVRDFSRVADAAAARVVDEIAAMADSAQTAAADPEVQEYERALSSLIAPMRNLHGLRAKERQP
jgi:hypothetical protein